MRCLLLVSYVCLWVRWYLYIDAFDCHTLSCNEGQCNTRRKRMRKKERRNDKISATAAAAAVNQSSSSSSSINAKLKPKSKMKPNSRAHRAFAIYYRCSTHIFRFIGNLIDCWVFNSIVILLPRIFALLLHFSNADDVRNRTSMCSSVLCYFYLDYVSMVTFSISSP